MLCNSHDPYNKHDNILVHEYAHTIKNYCLSQSMKSRVSLSNYQNQNSLLVKRQIDNSSAGALTRENILPLALTRDANQSLHISAEEIRVDGVIPVLDSLRREKKRVVIFFHTCTCRP